MLDRQLTQKQIDADLKSVYNFRTKSEKLSWIRKRKRILLLIEQNKPLEDQILELTRQKQPVMDKINKLRTAMSKECIHPKDSLIHKGEYVECKFCLNKIFLNRALDD